MDGLMESLDNIKAEEDFQTWDLYPRHRNLFNKMEVALQQGLHAGPAAVAPQKEGTYISRPIYNIYGMGIDAKKFKYTNDMYENIINNDIVPPGHFWCEWVEGDLLSVDFHRNPTTGVFYTRSIWQGEHYSKENLTKFKQWTRLENTIHPYDIKLDLPFNDDEVTAINIEMIDKTVIEVHLRLGNDPWDDLPVGTIVTPKWGDMEGIPEGKEFRGNLHEDMKYYGASGHLSDIRLGYIIERPIKASA